MNHFKLSTVAAALGVALGAFGAHALKGQLALSNLTETWKTAVLYHLVHAVALFALSSSSIYNRSKAKSVANLWLIGIVLFSGSLYTLCLTEIKILGAITPFGGLAFIAGWILLTFTPKN